MGEHIRKRRLILKRRQIDVALPLDVTAATVLNWEKGLTSPGNKHIPAIIAFLGYDPEPPDLETVADHLKAKRRELGWRQLDAARHLNVDAATWASWEGGGTIMRSVDRKRVARWLGLPERVVQDAMKRQWNDRHDKPTR